MESPRHTPAPAFFFLVLPFGISSSFAAVTLPFVLKNAGLPVKTVAFITAFGVFASVCSFLWGPMIDLTLTLRRWYGVGVAAAAGALPLLSLTPPSNRALLVTLVFLSQVAITWISLPVGGLMAHTVAEERKGRAAGWYQAGNLGGGAVGGGLGVWLTSHYSVRVAAVVLAAMMVACSAALMFVPDVRLAHDRLVERLRIVGRDFRAIVTSPIALLVIVLVSSPIGAGAMSNVWSAVADDWGASADRVALVTGLLASLVGAVGCVAGGWSADRWGRWRTFFGAGAFMAAVALGMSFCPLTPRVYSGGVLVYALSIGLAYAAYSALVLLAVGRGAASTKYAILGSLGNIPVVYMTALAGWSHDRFGPVGMLQIEAALSGVAIVAGIVAVWMLGAARTPSSHVRQEIS